MENPKHREARIDRIVYRHLTEKIQEILRGISSDIRGKAKVALFGTVIISPSNYFAHLQQDKNGMLEVSQPEEAVNAENKVRQFCELPPFTFPGNMELRDGDLPDGGIGTPAACPPPQLVEGKFIIESSSDCVTYPFYGMAFNLRGQTRLALNMSQYPPDMELLEGILWIKDFRSETAANLANVKVSGVDHKANIKPSAETGVDFSDNSQVRVFSTIGKTIVEVDYLPHPTEMKEKDDIIFLLADPEMPDASDNEASGTEMCVPDADGQGSPAAGTPDSQKNLRSSTAPGCSYSPDAHNFNNEAALKGTLTLGFLFILGQRKRAKTKKKK